MRELRIGVVDSGTPPERIAEARRFQLAAVGVSEQPAREDALGHGSAVVELIASGAGDVPIHVAQVFDERGITTALQVAAGIEWLVKTGVRLINLSLGLREDRTALRAACEAAQKAGVLICASTPAQGAAVYPAAYPGVVRITGDARCQRDEWSWLDSPQADFGACVRARESPLSGASFGCAALTGLIAGFLRDQPHATNPLVMAWLLHNAHYRGREYRGRA